MSQSQPVPQSHEQIETFAAPAGGRQRAYLCLAGGEGLVLMAVAGFFLALRTDPGPLQFQMMTTVPVLVAVGLFTAAFKTLRGPREVRVGEQELQVIDGRSGIRTWRWDQITFAETGTVAMSGQRQLTLHGSDGKPLLKLTSEGS